MARVQIGFASLLAMLVSVPVPAQEPVNHGIYVCVVYRGELRDVQVRYDPNTGDTLLLEDPRRFSDVYTAGEGYAERTAWYRFGETVAFRGKRYEKYGMPRVLGITEVQPIGDYLGVPVYAEAGVTDPAPDVVYIPVRPGCEFQPYVAQPVERRLVRGPRFAGDSAYVCRLRRGRLVEVAVHRDSLRHTAARDRAALPGPDYALRHPWFVTREPITFAGRRYLRRGPARVLAAGEVRLVGYHERVGVYVEAGVGGRPPVVYLPMRPGCEFQPYVLEEKTSFHPRPFRDGVSEPRFGHVPLAGAGLRAP